MNPLDPEEYLAIVRDINKEMPMHTPESVKIPFAYGHLPKNLMETSNKVMDKYLDDHLHAIEEIFHRQPKHSLPLWMRAYQSKYFRQARQFGHDGFFQNHITADLRDLRNIGRQGNTSSWLIPFGKVKGSTLTAGGTGNNRQLGDFRACRVQSNTVANSYYDRLACEVSSGNTGNVQLGCYDESAGNPNNRLADTGSVTCPAVGTGFPNPISVTEFQVTYAGRIWIALQMDSGSPFFVCDSGSLGVGYSTQRNPGPSYGTMPNPFGTLTNPGCDDPHLQVSHS